MLDLSRLDKETLLATRLDPCLFGNVLIQASGAKVVVHQMQVLMHDHLTACQGARLHCLWITPPEHTKSRVTISRAAWEIGRRPDLRVVITSADRDLAQRNFNRLRDYVVSPVFNSVFGGVRPGNARGTGAAKKEFNQTRLYMAGQTDPSVELTSLLGNWEGVRADFLIADDCVTRDCLRSEVERERIYEALTLTAFNRLSDEGIALILNNIWHREDPIHRFMESSSFSTLRITYPDALDCIEYEVINAPPGFPWAARGTLPLWSVWNHERLVRKREESTSAFKRMFRGYATVAEDLHFPERKLWKRYRPEMLEKNQGERIFVHLDPSGGRQVRGEDFAALVPLLRMTDGRCLVMADLLRMMRTTPEKQIDAIWDAHRELKRRGWGRGIDHASIEALPKDQEWLRLEINRRQERLREEGDPDWMLDIVLVSPGRESKGSRIESLITPMERGWILYPDDLEVQARSGDVKEFVQQIEDNPFGEHDDGPDALAAAWKRARLSAKFEPPSEELLAQRSVEAILQERAANEELEREQYRERLNYLDEVKEDHDDLVQELLG